MICRMAFEMSFGILSFDPKVGFCMGLSLFIMADFQNDLISGIFRLFWSVIFYRTTLNDL